MIILEKPYVSNTLISCAETNNFSVLRNYMSEKLVKQNFLMNDSEFKEKYQQTKRLYSTSENTLEWVYTHLSDSDLVKKIGLLKDKASFRRICKDIYPEFFFKEVEFGDLFNLNVSELKFPLVLKPSVGFLSAGVYVIENENDWKNALCDVKDNFEKQSSRFPDYVIGSKNFLLEEFIEGEEFAVDAYFDDKCDPVILNIFHHRFASKTDVSDRLYCTSKGLYDEYLEKFTVFLKKINKIIKLQNFPMHIEFKYNGKMAIPIEINPLRFAGFCLNEVQTHISGVHPVKSYLENLHPDYSEMWRGKETDVYTFMVLERPAGVAETAQISEEKLSKAFSNILELRKITDPSLGVLATMFTKSDKDHLKELDYALIFDISEYLK